MDVHVSYAINEAYVDYCRVSMLSLLTNNQQADVHFHILTDGLSAEARQKMEQTAEPYGATVSFYKIEDSYIDNLALSGFNRNIWLRIFLPELLDENIDRVLYLDTDTIVCGDITELFSVDLTNHSLAACMDFMGFSDKVFKRLGYPSDYGYICSGVMVFNLNYFRAHNLTEKILDFARKHAGEITFPDQDAINAACHKSMKLLPLKFDMLPPFFANETFVKQHEEEVKEMLADPRIIHYAGCNPWKKESRHRHFYESEFWKYAEMAGGIKRRWTKKGAALLKYFAMMTLGQLGVTRYKDFRFYQPTEFKEVKRLQQLLR